MLLERLIAYVACIAMLSASAIAQVQDPDFYRRDAAARHCAAQGGTFEPWTMQCSLPSKGPQPSSGGSNVAGGLFAAFVLFMGVAALAELNRRSAEPAAASDGGQPTPAPTPPKRITATAAVPASAQLALYRDPDPRSATVGRIPGHARGISVLGCNSQDGKSAWCELSWRGQQGWAPARSLRADAETQAAATQAVVGRINSFLEEFHAEAATDVTRLERFFAEFVDQHGKGRVPRAAIMKEKLAIAGQCPIRSYTVDYDSLKIFPVDLGRGLYDATFTVESTCRGGPVENVSAWQIKLGLDLSTLSTLIVAQRADRVGHGYGSIARKRAQHR